MIWDGTPRDSMRVFLENMVAEGFLARECGLDVTPQQIVAATIGQIDKIARESYPLHQVMSRSDIVFHAEGPGAASGMPWLSALNWLGRTAEGNLRKLSAAHSTFSVPRAPRWPRISTCASPAWRWAACGWA